MPIYEVSTEAIYVVGILSFLGGIYVFSHTYMLGSLCGGLMSGYTFVSFSVFGKIYIMENGRLTKKSYGPGKGQLNMIPPYAHKRKFPFLLFLFGGTVLNLLLSAMFIALYLCLRHVSLLSAALLGFAAAGLMMCVSSFMVGSKTAALFKSEQTRNIFRILGFVNSYMYSGKRWSDMPDEWFNVPYDVNNKIEAGIACINYDRLGERREFKKARELGEKMLNEMPGIAKLSKLSIAADLLFYEIIGGRPKEEIERLYTGNLKAYLNARPEELGKQTVLYAYSKLVLNDRANSEEIRKRIDVLSASYSMQCSVYDAREWIRVIDLISEKNENGLITLNKAGISNEIQL